MLHDGLVELHPVLLERRETVRRYGHSPEKDLPPGHLRGRQRGKLRLPLRALRALLALPLLFGVLGFAGCTRLELTCLEHVRLALPLSAILQHASNDAAVAITLVRRHRLAPCASSRRS